MSQNDPLLGNDWLEKEESNSGQVLDTIHKQINGKQFNIQLKNGLIDDKLTDNKSVNNIKNCKLDNNRLDLNKFESSIGFSSSDSSSDDIVIPMQRRRVKHRFSRKRRSRSTDSSHSSMKSGSLLSCPTVCLKVVSVLLIISTIAFSVLFIVKLYDRIDSLQIAINELSVSGNSVPQEMHSIHSHLKQLDSNSSSIRVELNRAFDIINNLSAEFKQMKLQMTQISDSVEAAPAIRLLPKELQDLQKVVADMGARLTTNDNEVKSVKDKQNTQQLKTDSLQSELTLIHSNISELNSVYEHNSNITNLSKMTESEIKSNANEINDLKQSLKQLNLVYTKLINWKTAADEKINQTLTLTHHLHEKFHTFLSNKEQNQSSTQMSNQTDSHNSD